MINCYHKFCIYRQNGICLKDAVTIDKEGFCADYLDMQKGKLFHLKKKLQERWTEK